MRRSGLALQPPLVYAGLIGRGLIGGLRLERAATPGVESILIIAVFVVVLVTAFISCGDYVRVSDSAESSDERRHTTSVLEYDVEHLVYGECGFFECFEWG